MIISFTCTCGNTDHRKSHFYDGALGYEAIICTICGRYSDYSGWHPADEFSKSYSLTVPVLSTVDRQRFLNQTSKVINPSQRSADEFTSGLAWQIFYARYQNLHLKSYGSYLMLSHEIYDRIPEI